eukprot:TRINITY_DN47312_c0_g1_i1.p1 TRINITY_DN47312_c0_g1~~TRINITY_DN47312_c0_g1_i1.p1  ORF type:complete len:193 (+),score=65.41 TRINITY_DN47312_c0_g1_i1:184-762(+)
MGCANGKQVLLEDDIQFLVKYTNMKEEEVKEHYENFITNHPKGKMDKSSFTEMMNLCYPDSNKDNIQKHIFRMYDSNMDGIIDFREFMLVVYIMSSGTPEENLKQIFKLLDINSDGSVSIGEFKRVIRDMFLLTNEKEVDSSIQELLAEKAFIEMDSDSDGKVTLEEFIAACLSQKKFSTMLTSKIIDVFVD